MVVGTRAGGEGFMAGQGRMMRGGGGRVLANVTEKQTRVPHLEHTEILYILINRHTNLYD